jgi:hypothetical protein
VASAAAEVQHHRTLGQRGRHFAQLHQIRALRVDAAGQVGAGGIAELLGDDGLLLHDLSPQGG